MFSVLITVVIAVWTMRRATMFFNERPKWLDSTFEEFLTPNEEGKNIIDMIADRFATGIRMSLLGQKSGESRHTKMIEKRVFEAAKNNIPELKIGLKVLENWGLGDLLNSEDMPAVVQIAKKYGLLKEGTIQKYVGGGPSQRNNGGMNKW